MLQQFINFVLSVNILSSITLCVGFVILAVGILAPIVNLILASIWAIIDESEEVKGANWFIMKATSLLPAPAIRYIVYTDESDYHVYDIKLREYCYKYDNRTQRSKDCDTRFTTLEAAELRAATLEAKRIPKGGPLQYFLTVLMVPTGLTILSLAFNYYFWPTVWLVCVIGSIWVLRAIRRLHKKALEVVSNLKKHTELKADEAHKGE